MLKKKYFKTKDVCEVTFEHEAEAQEVALVSESNNWQPIEMKKRRKDGIFYTKVRLPKDGRYQYRYLLNNHSWSNDTAADAYIPNEYGSENSVVITSKVSSQV
jgi:1,4-alpha-glucan branching enzyme